MERKIVIYGNRFLDFYHKQDRKIQQKIEYVLDMVRFEKLIPQNYFKFLTGSNGIYEIKVKTTFKNIRILCFLDKGNLVILTNCFLKKTKKTPIKEIKIAEKLKKEYIIESEKL